MTNGGNDSLTLQNAFVHIHGLLWGLVYGPLSIGLYWIMLTFGGTAPQNLASALHPILVVYSLPNDIFEGDRFTRFSIPVL